MRKGQKKTAVNPTISKFFSVTAALKKSIMMTSTTRRQLAFVEAEHGFHQSTSFLIVSSFLKARS